MSLGFVHTMKHNKGNERPKCVLFADVESRLIEGEAGKIWFDPFLWVLIYKRYRYDTGKHSETEIIGSSIPEFWDHVEQYCYKRSTTYLVTHHLEVDFMPMKGFTELQGRGWTMNKLIANGRTLIMYWRKDTYKLVVMNNGNLFDGSIEDWGKKLGLPKLSMPADDAGKDEWDEYCLRDCKIMVAMWDNLLTFMDKHDTGNFKVTKASMALTCYRHRFMPIPIAIHNDTKTITLERDSYHGGRFEALKIGNQPKQPYYMLDITSMYGWIMAEYELPYELRGYKEQCSVDELIKRCHRYCVIAEVDVTINDPVFPIYQGDKIFFKTGRFDLCLTTDELLYAHEHGIIHSVKRMSWYYKAKVLSDYAKYFLKLKDEYEASGNTLMRQLVKLYLNSLYGKFGQHGYEDVIIGDCPQDEFKFISAYDYDKKERYTIAHYSGEIHETKITEAGSSTFVAIASHITAYGRLYLYKLMTVAGIDNVYHVATDSLVVNQAGYDRLHEYIGERVPGLLKVENVFQEYVVKDVNDVIIDGVIKIKGIPKKAVMVDPDTFRMTEWPRITTLLKGGVVDRYYTRTTTKRLTRKRYHGKLDVVVMDVPSDRIGRIKGYREKHEPKSVPSIKQIKTGMLSNPYIL